MRKLDLLAMSNERLLLLLDFFEGNDGLAQQYTGLRADIREVLRARGLTEIVIGARGVSQRPRHIAGGIEQPAGRRSDRPA